VYSNDFNFGKVGAQWVNPFEGAFAVLRECNMSISDCNRTTKYTNGDTFKLITENVENEQALIYPLSPYSWLIFNYHLSFCIALRQFLIIPSDTLTVN